MNNKLFWELLEPEHTRAEAFCRKLTGNRDDGDDLYQEALVLAMAKLGSLRDHGAFRPWLYRIIVNAFRSRNRRPWWRGRVRLQSEHTNSLQSDPSGQFDARRWLERAFTALKPEEKALIILFEVEGWSVAEIAALQGAPTGTIKARLSRSRSKMRDHIAALLKSADKTAKKSEAGYALPQSETATD
jgi:RNA polymerase sigma-70 factor (ECF subfamily)